MAPIVISDASMADLSSRLAMAHTRQFTGWVRSRGKSVAPGAVRRMDKITARAEAQIGAERADPACARATRG
jgi:hypothetical protein